MTRRVQVFGPAYLDRVLRIDRPLLAPALSPPLDQSVDGRLGVRSGAPIDRPRRQHGRDRAASGLARSVGRGAVGTTFSRHRGLRGLATRRARPALARRPGRDGGRLRVGLRGGTVSALGPEDDPTSLAVATRLAHYRIAHRPIRVAGHAADWTLLVTSGQFGDKLPIGFRGCHAALAGLPAESIGAVRPPRRRVAAEPAGRRGAPEALARRSGSSPRRCGTCSTASRRSRASHAASTCSPATATNGTASPTARRSPGRSRSWRSPTARAGAWSGSRPPRERRVGSRSRRSRGSTHPATRTGRARRTRPRSSRRLLDRGWEPGVADPELVRTAAERASAAAALELDRVDFGFPTPEAIDAAVRAGRVD